jgi:hypothetical protein
VLKDKGTPLMRQYMEVKGNYNEISITMLDKDFNDVEIRDNDIVIILTLQELDKVEK